MARSHTFYMTNFGQKSKTENEKCKRLSEKSHKYSHHRQEKCIVSLYPNMNMMIKMMCSHCLLMTMMSINVKMMDGLLFSFLMMI